MKKCGTFSPSKKQFSFNTYFFGFHIDPEEKVFHVVVIKTADRGTIGNDLLVLTTRVHPQYRLVMSKDHQTWSICTTS